MLHSTKSISSSFLKFHANLKKKNHFFIRTLLKIFLFFLYFIKIKLIIIF